MAEVKRENTMIIIKVMGGLGNQLQQYALYKKLESLGRDVRLDISWFQNTGKDSGILAHRDLELDYFEHPRYRAASPEEIRSVLGRLWEEPETLASRIRRKILPATDPCFQESGLYHAQVFTMSDKYLVGYWACEKYYGDILDELRQQLCFPPCGDTQVQRRNIEMMDQMESTESVSVHIRRGDYLDAANSALFGGISTEAYYDGAISYIRRHFPQAVFYFFSDDIPYVREHYAGQDCQIIDWNQGRNSFYDMMLMSHCKHNICANSTFSFWGARLNAHAGKCMIRPSIHKNTQICVPEQMKELWPGWTLITPSGDVL